MRLVATSFVAAFHFPPMHDPGPEEFRRPVSLLRLVAMHEGGRTGECLATENEREELIRAPAQKCSAHAVFFAAGKNLAAHIKKKGKAGFV